MTISATVIEMNKQKGILPDETPKINPFPRLTFVNLDEVLPHLKGKDFLAVKEHVVSHMTTHNIHAACILCSGQTKKCYRHFVNMPAVPTLVPEVQKTTHLTHLIHWESSGGIVALKVNAMKAEVN